MSKTGGYGVGALIYALLARRASGGSPFRGSSADCARLVARIGTRSRPRSRNDLPGGSSGIVVLLDEPWLPSEKALSKADTVSKHEVAVDLVDQAKTVVSKEARRIVPSPCNPRPDHEPTSRPCSKPRTARTRKSRRTRERGEQLMWASFGWGTLAASTLVVGAVLAMVFRISLRTIGLIMGFGAGVLISAVAFDLVQEAADSASGNWPLRSGHVRRLRGVRRRGLADRPLRWGRPQGPGRAQKDGSALAIVLGSVLDGIPESMVIGLTISKAGRSAPPT